MKINILNVRETDGIRLRSLIPAWLTRCFFSAGFKIWKEHMRVSSTLIMAPKLERVRVREREWEWERVRERMEERECVCVRERESERER